MVQSESNKKIEPPKRSLSTEFFVGLFVLVGLGALGYQAVGLGGLQLFGSDKYEIMAEFDNVAGLKTGSPVELAGVAVGEVHAITLNDPFAVVHMRIDADFQVRDDDIASIRTKGIIGDRYVKISRGGSELFLSPGDMITDTESVVDIEDLIGKFVHNFGSDDEEDENIEIE